jgi:hypothetical protein
VCLGREPAERGLTVLWAAPRRSRDDDA